jgi:hypothetical protein
MPETPGTSLLHRLAIGSEEILGEVAVGCRFGPGLFVEEVSEPHQAKEARWRST